MCATGFPLLRPGGSFFLEAWRIFPFCFMKMFLGRDCWLHASSWNWTLRAVSLGTHILQFLDMFCGSFFDLYSVFLMPMPWAVDLLYTYLPVVFSLYLCVRKTKVTFSSVLTPHLSTQGFCDLGTCGAISLQQASCPASVHSSLPSGLPGCHGPTCWGNCPQECLRFSQPEALCWLTWPD